MWRKMKHIGAVGLIVWLAFILPVCAQVAPEFEVAGDNANPAKDADPEKGVSQYLIYLTWYIHGKTKGAGGFGIQETLRWCMETYEIVGKGQASTEKMQRAIRGTSQSMRLTGQFGYHQNLHQQPGGTFSKMWSKAQLGDKGTLNALNKQELKLLSSGSPGLNPNSFSSLAPDGNVAGQVVIDPSKKNFGLFPEEADAATAAAQKLEGLRGSVQPALDIVPPVFLPDPKSSPVSAPTDRLHASRLVVKTSYEEQSPFAYRKELRSLEKAVNGMAGSFLFSDALKEFNPQVVVANLIRHAGVNMLGSGIVSRPAAMQDAAFIKYVGLRNNRTDETLFWSDPMVSNGYDPFLGTVLNNTALKGYKTVDMDNVLSCGYSSAIDEWNSRQPLSDRVPNPFKGYAAKVTPGLLKLQEEGRLEPDKNLSKEQLEEAMKLTPTLRALPSQTMASSRQTSALRYSGRGEDASSFAFIRIGGSQDAVPLDPLALAVHEKAMTVAAYRLKEIDELKKDNRGAYGYVSGLIGSYFSIDGALKSVVETMASYVRVNDIPPKGTPLENAPVYMACIPEIALLRQQVWAAIENLQRQLSELEHQYDQLKQNEWEVLDRVLDVKKKSIKSLMGNGSMRYNTAKFRKAYGG